MLTIVRLVTLRRLYYTRYNCLLSTESDSFKKYIFDKKNQNSDFSL